MRGATFLSARSGSTILFQSTLLMRGATPGTGLHAACELISIHAPHARSDVVWSKTAEIVGISIHAPHARSDESCSSSIVSDSDFNPRSSCEERQTSSYWLVNLAVFQSTLLMRGATDASCRHDGRNIFQSTLLMRGATALRINSNVGHYFNPRSSCEERRCPRRVSAGTQRISIHAPHARSDARHRTPCCLRVNFNPRSSCEERRRLEQDG